MQKFIPLILVLVFGISVSSCGIESATDKIVVAIDKALKELNEESTNWQEILVTLEDTLITEGQETIANEVDQIAGKATQGVAVEARCSADFIVDRIKNQLMLIRARYVKTQIDTQPVFCYPVPSSIDYEQYLDGSVKTIVIDGYNLTKVGMNLYLLKGGERVQVNSALHNPSGFLLTVTFGGPDGLKLTPDSTSLIFVFPDGTERDLGVTFSPVTKITYILNSNPDDLYKKWFGGGQGDGGMPLPGVLSCPPGYVGVEITGSSGGRVDSLGLTCGKLNVDGSITNKTPTMTFGGTGGTIAINLSCASNQVLTGIHGRAFQEVDRIGATCNSIENLFSEISGIAEGTLLDAEFGGKGGDVADGQCPEKHVLVGLVTLFNERIFQITVLCQEVLRTVTVE